MDQREYWRRGLEHLRSGRFFDAHEEWEIPWRKMQGDRRSFWQAMIQWSVGAYHYQNGNLTGCRNLWTKALRRCEEILHRRGSASLSVVEQLREHLRDRLAEVERGENPLPAVLAFARNEVTGEWFDGLIGGLESVR